MKKVKDLAKNLIESFKRRNMHGNVFSFQKKGRIIKFYLPVKKDWIQQQIIVKNDFYELDLLKKVEKYIPKGTNILDIGSNIGNHIIYFSKILGARKVYGFEPQKNVFEILKKNIELNKLERKTQIFNFGLGKEESSAKLDEIEKNNCGGNSIKKAKEGDLKIKVLDKLFIKDKINFIKIDTEGFEKDVLLGAKKTIQKNNPVVWVEVDRNNKDFVNKYFTELGYSKKKFLDKENWVFIPKNSQK